MPVIDVLSNEVFLWDIAYEFIKALKNTKIKQNKKLKIKNNNNKTL